MLYENATNNGQSGYAIPAEKELQELGAVGLYSLVPLVIDYAIHVQTILPYNIDQASPFVCNCLYRFAVWLSGATDISPRSNNAKALRSVKDALHKLGSRWMVASMFQTWLAITSLKFFFRGVPEDTRRF